MIHTRHFLLAVSSNGANDCILLPIDTVLGSLSVSLGLSSVILGFAGSVLLLARLGP